MKTESHNLKKYLYLLKAGNRPFFKIGVSSGSMHRINALILLMGVERDASFVVLASNPQAIIALEKYLLKKYIQYSLPFELEEEIRIGLGQSELRSTSCFPLVMADIISNDKLQLFSLKDFSEFCPNNPRALAMRIDQDLSDLANKQAAKKGISLAGYIRMLILADIEKDKPSA